MAELVSEHDWVLRQTLSDGHPVHGHLRDAVEVDERRRDHEHVEYLVTLELYAHFFSGESSTVLWGGSILCSKGEDYRGLGGYGKSPMRNGGLGNLLSIGAKL